MSPFPKVYISILILSGIAAYWWAVREEDSDPLLVTSIQGDTKPINLPTAYTGTVNSSQIGEPDSAASSSNHSMPQELEVLLRHANIQNDWVLSLNKDEIKSLEENATRLGLSFIGGIPELGVVRVKILDTGKALPLLGKLVNQDRLSRNYKLRQPLPPRTEHISEGGGFSGNYIDWLGGTKDRGALGAGIKVALLDSGVDPSHPMLSGVSIKQKNLLPSPIAFENGHGTALASVIAGRGQQSHGLAPKSEILSYRVIDDTGKTDSYTVASGIVQAVKDGARVINLSLGGDHGSVVLKHAISYARDHGASIVAAVGNEGEGIVNFPAAYGGVIGVGSVGQSGRVSSFSNFGEGVDITAPGVGLSTAWKLKEMASFSGTSVSAAIVSGAIAAELANARTLTNRQVEDLLLDCANDSGSPGHDAVAGHGVLSLARLENRGNTSYSDPALVGYHFPASVGAVSGTMPFEVVVQNQGNTWLGNLTLHVDYLRTKRSFKIDNLAPGEVRSEKLYLQGDEVSKVFQMNARLQVPIGTADHRPGNNSRSSSIKF